MNAKLEIVGVARGSQIVVEFMWMGSIVATGSVDLATWDDMRGTSAIEDDDLLIWAIEEKRATEGVTA